MSKWKGENENMMWKLNLKIYVNMKMNKLNCHVKLTLKRKFDVKMRMWQSNMILCRENEIVTWKWNCDEKIGYDVEIKMWQENMV